MNNALSLNILVLAIIIVSIAAFKPLISFRSHVSCLEMAQEPWVYDTAPKSAREKAAFKSQIPFSEETYDTLKGSIELLSRRMKAKAAEGSDMSIDEKLEAEKLTLTLEEAKWLSNAVETLIEDAYKYGPPARPVLVNSPEPATYKNGIKQPQPEE
mmetsp:Transcript_13544/g.13137  ORF Transcript_13544/g.13137 Transcript_13544/m.13137 type:complete len:156 (-) Transcript_13544:490-957(-)|eukprot:CAMPEP_0119038642 /NCGR_PEP_ID=MMETSP1177-20130426/7691_1 /TAXON_ID=2985 /ORGANISM="Ochromonas sp, Strain CCMP1899" /LENGTH=155 /DNA_ID=CAMNT_0007001497 /DNA_START=126 /DNA_END=593 /DNA_ORIENTATION=-